MRFRLASVLLAASLSAADNETQIQYLSGRGHDDAVLWDFLCSAGRKSNTWTKIPVPSCWELHGFGAYAYGRAARELGEQGRYRHNFVVPANWRDKTVFLVFDGVMTDAEVSLNGKPAGPRHCGAFYRFQYDVTTLLKPGQTNRLEVLVSKISTNESVTAAERHGDYWVFGGIFRPVWLKAVPQQFIDRVAIDARADGSFSMNVFIGGKPLGADRITAQIEGLGPEFSTPITTDQTTATLETRVKGHRNWTAETPHLYRVKVSLKKGDTTIHTITERFGFRTVEVRPGEGLFINGQRVCLKGCCRHSFWPESGRTTSEKISRNDVRLIKEMNMNAVRTTHYPPDQHFLQACDELGLYVITELAGWQKKYDTGIGRQLLGEMLRRDINHPSIIFWANGNEGGWNTELDDEFARWDPQQRPVLHPGATFRGINTAHYLSYSNHIIACTQTNLYLPTEFLHGLYDGGAGAGLEDHWNAIRTNKTAIGGFIWAFLDEGVVRTDKGNRIDCAGNWAPDGILGPHREKEASFFTIRKLWSPIHASVASREPHFIVALENCYDFTNLKNCRFRWQLLKFPLPTENTPTKTLNSGRLIGPDAKPGQKANLRIPLPGNWRSGDAVMLEAFAPNGDLICNWVWLLRPGHELANVLPQPGKGAVGAQETGNRILVVAGPMRYTFSADDARLLAVATEKQTFNFANGPRLVFSGKPEKSGPFNPYYTTVTHQRDGDSYTIELRRGGGFDWLRWRILPNGVLELKYRYPMHGTFNYFGVTFDLPEHLVRAKRWLGEGPYRIYKNRLSGPEWGVHEVAYNDPVPGASWKYPEFKGYFGHWHWLRLNTTQGTITFATPTDGLFHRLYTPRLGTDTGSIESRRLIVPYPPGDISFMHAIPPIGNKFHEAEQTGPQGQPTRASGKYEATLYIHIAPSQRTSANPQ
ncbi:MAG: glycoside hydrolase family 2 [Verrucomicrobiae bacterium]|nr:glycoside hydrolase family 2 [Verrucomicrobiae bacterium]